MSRFISPSILLLLSSPPPCTPLLLRSLSSSAVFHITRSAPPPCLHNHHHHHQPQHSLPSPSLAAPVKRFTIPSPPPAPTSNPRGPCLAAYASPSPLPWGLANASGEPLSTRGAVVMMDQRRGFRAGHGSRSRRGPWVTHRHHGWRMTGQEDGEDGHEHRARVPRRPPIVIIDSTGYVVGSEDPAVPAETARVAEVVDGKLKTATVEEVTTVEENQSEASPFPGAAKQEAVSRPADLTADTDPLSITNRWRSVAVEIAPSPSSLIPFLEASRLWPGLDKEALAALAAQMDAVVLAKDEVLCREGEVTGFLYVIAEGTLDVVKNVPSKANETVKLITLSPGEYAGESTLLEGTPLTATLIASSTPTRILRLSITSFRSLLETNPLISNALLRGLSAELRAFRTVLARAMSDHKDLSAASTPSLKRRDSLVAVAKNPKVRVTRMAVFDFMKHEKVSFEAAVDKFRNERLNPDTDALEIVYLECKLGPSTVGLAAGCQVVCIFVNDNANAEVLTLLAAQGVKLLTLRCAGFDNVDLKAAAALDITVTRVPAYSPYAVAEFAATLCMSLNRKIVAAHGRVRQGNFSLANLVGFDIHGKTVGVIGTGKIGQCFIKIMQGFGCDILCYDAYPSKEVASWERCRYVELDELLAKSKIISLHCPLLPSTKHLINQDSIAKMQRGVVLINTSRGGLVHTQHLIQALKSGHVAAAGLDVYENERSLFFEDHSGNVMEDDAFARLLTFQNVIVTGHQAFLTEEALDKIASVTVDNIFGYCVEGKKGKELENVVA
ncbi:hypothetical protein HDU96_009924 [Phlyctochytrium bullatum]|nr:hypothetical protein HDU96_009924 [Phlyctochytrium bullatum]